MEEMEEASVPRSPTWPRRTAWLQPKRNKTTTTTRYKKRNVIKNIFGETRRIYETFVEARTAKTAARLLGTITFGRMGPYA